MSRYNQRYFSFFMKTLDPWITDIVVENTTWLHFSLNHWEMWHLMLFHFQLWIDLWANQARLPDTCYTYTIKAMWLLYDSLHPHKSGQVWGFFFPEGSVVFYKTASTKKILYKSHSSLNSEWWAVLTLKPGSEQSLAYIFQEICDSCCGEYLLFFSIFVFLSDLQSMFIVFKVSSVSTNWSLL